MIGGAFLAAVIHPPLWIEMPAVIAGALAGALYAHRRGLDIIGLLGFAVVNGLGGGLLRDILLARVPLALQEPRYLAAVAGAAVLAAFFARAVDRVQIAMVAIDAVSLGLFAVIGAQSALIAGLPILSAIFLGTVTGIGGGLLRDVLAGDVPPEVFRRGPPYASAAFLGATLYVSLVQGLDTPRGLAQIAAVVLVCAIRWVGVWRGWETPGPYDLGERMWRRRRGAHEPPGDDLEPPGRATDGA